MKIPDFLTRKKTLSWIFILLWALLFILFVYLHDADRQSAKETAQFQEILQELFYQEMTSNTLNMHYTIADPKQYGISDYKAILPCYNAANREDSREEQAQLIRLLQEIDPTRLSEADAYTRQLFLSYLTYEQELLQYPYYEEPLSPSSGMQSQLPILLAEYTFRSKRDVEDYLALLDQSDEYFAGLLVFEQEKAASGLLQSTVSLEKVREQCSVILTEDALDTGTHFLQTTFRERLAELYAQNMITQKELLYYISQNDRLLRTVMLPAYDALSDGLLLLENDSIELKGLAFQPHGKEYYMALLREQTGSFQDIEEIREMLTSQFSQEYQALLDLYQNYPTYAASGFSAEDCDALFPYQTPEEMLADLCQRMQEDFPVLPLDTMAAEDTRELTAAVSELQPGVMVKTISESLESYSSPAFYLTPPLDDTDNNVIYINERNSPQGLELYTTLAHEGYPGHLYQSVYSNRDLLDDACGPARQLLWYGGYLEGWALYVEFIGYDYAAEMMAELDVPQAAWYVLTEKHNRSLLLCLYSLLDIMIHYDGVTYAQIHRILANLGIDDPKSTYAVYEYIVEEPTNYLKYYLGYLEILSLQQDAHALWDTEYSPLRFHSFLLKYGPADFQTLTEMIGEG